MAKRILFRDGKMVFRGGKLVFVEEGQAGDCECCEGDPCVCAGIADWSAKKLAVLFGEWMYEAQYTHEQINCNAFEADADFAEGTGFIQQGTLDFVSATSEYITFSGTITDYHVDLLAAMVANDLPDCDEGPAALLDHVLGSSTVGLSVRWSCVEKRWEYRFGSTGDWEVIADGYHSVIFAMPDFQNPICAVSDIAPFSACGGGTARESFHDIVTTAGFSQTNTTCFYRRLTLEDA